MNLNQRWPVRSYPNNQILHSSNNSPLLDRLVLIFSSAESLYIVQLMQASSTSAAAVGAEEEGMANGLAQAAMLLRILRQTAIMIQGRSSGASPLPQRFTFTMCVNGLIRHSAHHLKSAKFLVGLEAEPCCEPWCVLQSPWGRRLWQMALHRNPTGGLWCSCWQQRHKLGTKEPCERLESIVYGVVGKVRCGQTDSCCFFARPLPSLPVFNLNAK